MPASLKHVSTVLVLAWGSATGVLPAQDTASFASDSLPRNGFQLRSISIYGAYYSKTLPNGGGFQPGATALASDFNGGASAIFGWTKFSDRSTFSLSYTSSYTGRVRYSSLNAFQHALSLSASRKIAPRWTFGFSLGGNLSTLEQSLFSPTTLGNVASVPSTFDDLAAGVLASKFTNNPQLGTVLTGSQLIESPVRNLLYGQRMLTSSAGASLSYSYSPRLSVTFNGGGGRTQHLSDGQTGSTGAGYLVPDTTSGNASVAISYSLSPLTQIGGTVSAVRTVSSLQDAYTTTSLVTLGRTLGMRWFMQVHGGVADTIPVRETSFRISTKLLPAYGGTLGFKTLAHTFLGSFDRTASDAYGLGAATTTGTNATWRWRRPGRNWWMESNLGWQRLGGNAVSQLSGWQTSAGLGRIIGAHFSLFSQYAYLSYTGSGLPSTSANGISQSAVRVSLVWSPHAGTLH
jgi:hypothetical protein